MYFNSFEDFIAMGGHGFYVWLCYAVSLSALIFYFVYSNKLASKNKNELKKFYLRLDSQKSKKDDIHQAINLSNSKVNPQKSKVEVS